MKSYTADERVSHLKTVAVAIEPSGTWDAHGGRRAADACGEAARAAAALPCLLLTTAPSSENPFEKIVEKPLGSRTAIARKAETLRRNLQDLINRVSIERIGFMTLTFIRNVRSRKLAEKRFHSFATHVLSQLVDEHIAVPERQERGAIHYHLAVAFPFDIRTGFDFAACSKAKAWLVKMTNAINQHWHKQNANKKSSPANGSQNGHDSLAG